MLVNWTTLPSGRSLFIMPPRRAACLVRYVRERGGGMTAVESCDAAMLGVWLIVLSGPTLAVSARLASSMVMGLCDRWDRSSAGGEALRRRADVSTTFPPRPGAGVRARTWMMLSPSLVLPEMTVEGCVAPVRCVMLVASVEAPWLSSSGAPRVALVDTRSTFTTPRISGSMRICSRLRCCLPPPR